MNIRQENCPDSTALIGFILGTIASEELESVAAHVCRCSRCDETVARLEDTKDDMITELRRPPLGDGYADEPACRHVVAAIEAIRIGANAPMPERSESRPEVEKDPLLGRRFGQYQLLEKLGQGGMGVVYKALHEKLDKLVAVKILRHDRLHEPSALVRFEREIRAAGQHDDPHIVRATDAGEWQGSHYLVMEFVDGADVAKLLRNHNRLRIADACEIVRQAALGLQEAHNHGMVHRDIKPSNLILARGRDTKPPIVKILDMGLALLHERQRIGEDDVTQAGQIMGTLDYMAPEQGDDSHTVDIRADIHSLGAALYKLLTGDAPFSGTTYATNMRKLSAIATEPAPPIADRRSDLPPGFAEIIHRMLANDVVARYATPAHIAEALEPFCAGQDLNALLVHSPEKDLGAKVNAASTASIVNPVSRLRRRKTATVVMTALLLVLSVVLVVALLRSTQPTAAHKNPNYEAVRWALSVGGTVHVLETKRGKDIRRRITSIYELPFDSYGLEIKLPSDKRVSPEALVRLAKAKKIVRLMLPDVGDKSLAAIAPMKQLRHLSVKGPPRANPFVGTPLTNAGMKHLAGFSNLQSLRISGADATDEGLAYLSKLKKLRMLKLYLTKITDDGLAHLHSLCDLEHLTVGYGKITDDGIKHLRHMTKLRYFNSAHCGSITGRGLDNLSMLKDLVSLGFMGTSLDDTGLEQIGRFANIISLSLEATKVTDDGLRKLFDKLPALSTVNLRDNPQLTDVAIEPFTKRKGPLFIFVENTNVTALGVAKIHAVQPGRMIHCDYPREEIDRLLAKIKNSERKQTEKK